MERNSSSDEESDQHHLIGENCTKNENVSREDQALDSAAGTRSAFHVQDIGLSVQRRLRLSLKKRHLIVIFLPLVIVLLYLSAGFRNYFSVDVSALRSVSTSGREQAAELQTLYLLRQQQLALFSLWNRTVLHYTVNSSSTNPNSSSFDSLELVEDVKSAILKQISLNKEIQNVLLSPYRTGNVSESKVFGDPSSDRYPKLNQRLSERKTIEWKPNPNKFLLAICLSGQMSNHLICLEKHMFFAALLNRVLVIPSHKFDYRYSRVLDINHINNCLGRQVVVSFEEFMGKKKEKNHHHVHIDRFICYFSLPQPCYIDEDHIKKLKGLGLSIRGKLETPWVEDIHKPSKKMVKEVEDNFKSDDDVIAIGDVFYADVEKEWVMQPGGPIAHKCKTLIEPSRLILITAQRFIQTFLGENYVSLHFRRHGFLKFCNAKTPSCFYPIPQAANCISQVIERAGAPVIYLSTDSAESETSLLQSLLVVNGKNVPLVKRPARNAAEKWDALLYRHGIEGDSHVEAMLDKTICAMSKVFIGASGSTFTDDIMRLRKDWGSASSCDEYLCRGEKPNFVAEDE